MGKIFKKHTASGASPGSTTTTPAATTAPPAAATTAPTAVSTLSPTAQSLASKLMGLQSKLEQTSAIAQTAKSNYEQFKQNTPFDDSEVPSAINPCASLIKFNKFISSSEYVSKNNDYIKSLNEYSVELKNYLTEANSLKTQVNSALSAATIKQTEFETINPENLLQKIKNDLSKNNTELDIANKTLKMFQITLPFKQRYVKVLARLCRAQNIKKKHDATGLKYVSDLRNLKLGYDDAIKIIKQWQAAFLSQVPKQKITSKEQAELMSESFVQAILEIETEKRKLVFERFKSTFGRK